MTSKANGQIAEIRTDVRWIREEMKDLKSHLDRLPCNAHDNRIQRIEDYAKTSEKEANKRTGLIAFIISTIVAVIGIMIGRK